MKQKEQALNNIIKETEPVYTPSSIEDEAKSMQEENGIIYQFPCSFEWHLCDGRGTVKCPKPVETE